MEFHVPNHFYFPQLFSAHVPGVKTNVNGVWEFSTPSKEWFHEVYTVGDKLISFDPVIVDKILDPDPNDKDKASNEDKMNTLHQIAFLIENNLKTFVDNVSDAPKRAKLKNDLKKLKATLKMRKRGATQTTPVPLEQDPRVLIKKIKAIRKRLRHVPKVNKARRNEIAKHILTGKILSDGQILRASQNLQEKLIAGARKTQENDAVSITPPAWLDAHVANQVAIPKEISDLHRDIHRLINEITIKEEKLEEQLDFEMELDQMKPGADKKQESEEVLLLKKAIDEKQQRIRNFKRRIKEYGKKREDAIKLVPKKIRQKKYAEEFLSQVKSYRIKKKTKVSPNTKEAVFVRTVAFMMAGHIDPARYASPRAMVSSSSPISPAS